MHKSFDGSDVEIDFRVGICEEGPPSPGIINVKHGIFPCPRCFSKRVREDKSSKGTFRMKCLNCGYVNTDYGHGFSNSIGAAHDWHCRFRGSVLLLVLKVGNISTRFPNVTRFFLRMLGVNGE